MLWATAFYANHSDCPMDASGSGNAQCDSFEIPPKNSCLFSPYFKGLET